MSQENILLILQYAGKLLNSRIGLVLIFMLYTSSEWGLGHKLDEINRNTAMLKDIQEMEMRNTERIAQLAERCKIIETGEKP